MRGKVILEPCVACDKKDCGATMILSAVASGTKRFDQAKDSLDLICPACNRAFSVSIFKLQWLEVDERELAQGFFRASYADSFLSWINSHLSPP